MKIKIVIFVTMVRNNIRDFIRTASIDIINDYLTALLRIAHVCKTIQFDNVQLCWIAFIELSII